MYLESREVNLPDIFITNRRIYIYLVSGDESLLEI